jgi:hypothetical protein
MTPGSAERHSPPCPSPTGLVGLSGAVPGRASLVTWQGGRRLASVRVQGSAGRARRQRAPGGAVRRARLYVGLVPPQVRLATDQLLLPGRQNLLLERSEGDIHLRPDHVPGVGWILDGERQANKLVRIVLQGD